MMKPIDAYSLSDLSDLLVSLKQPKYRLQQLIEWVYQRDVDSYDGMTNLPLSLREHLQQVAPLIKPMISQRRDSRDGTRKYLVAYPDGACVETVAIPSQSKGDRLTVCFSTQVGCAMGCTFCATGREGCFRNLGSGEMLRQITEIQKDTGRRVTNIVAMGQGEPFLNYENTLGALQIMNASYGLSIGARKITVSSCGIIPGIERFSQRSEQFTLAVSLHAARQEIRDLIMPKMKAYPLEKLKEALRAYVEKTNRRVTLEYLLLDGVNDSLKDRDALARFCSGLLCHINLLPLNAVEGAPYQPSPQKRVDAWLSWFEEQGIETTLRVSRGSDIEGACGQLKQKGCFT